MSEQEVAGRTPLTRQEIEEIRAQADASAWVIFFEDPDHLPEFFSGPGAEYAANERFKQALMTWSCHLFREVDTNIPRLCDDLLAERKRVEELEAEVARLSSPDLRVVYGYEAGQKAAEAEVARLREALAQVRFPLEVAASYVGDPGNTLGMNIHAKDCAKALSVLDAVLEGKEPKP